MIVFRRRLIFWLVRAYFRKWGRSILLFFVIGLLGFFALRYAAGILPSSFPFLARNTIGMTGAYTINDLPPVVLEKISSGLTSVSEDGSIHPDIASSWKIEKNGKEYVFNLRKNIYFSDGTHLTSKQISYSFTDAILEKPDDYTVVFKLKDAYSPFLVTVSRPIFKKGFVGLGEYRVKDLKLNGNFVSTIDLIASKKSSKILKYVFYPTEDALKTAFVLGEISEIKNIHDLTFQNKELSSFSSVKVQKELNQRQLVTLFFNTKDQILSDKKIREAISYSISDNLAEGFRNRGPFSPSSWANSNIGLYGQDIEHAKEVLKTSSASDSASLKIIIKSLSQYTDVAREISENINRIGIKTKIEEVDSVPDSFQIFLGDFNLSRDPDQYLLWHSDQNSNITGYKNLRIDKLLEDGRKIVNLDERKRIYSDFQKYLLDDAPASFLYLPYTYNISRN